MTMKCRFAMALLGLAVAGCSDESTDSGPTPQESERTIRRFQAYELPEYSLQETDIVSGLGGRWITRRYILKQNESVRPADIRRRVHVGLEQEGWEKKPLPNRKYVLSKIFETSHDDLYYSHGPFDDDQDHLFYNQAVHVSDDGRTVVCYYEIGW